MRSVSVPPISSVIGVSRMTAIAARARYEGVERTNQPFASREYEVTIAAT